MSAAGMTMAAGATMVAGTTTAVGMRMPATSGTMGAAAGRISGSVTLVMNSTQAAAVAADSKIMEDVVESIRQLRALVLCK